MSEFEYNGFLDILDPKRKALVENCREIERRRLGRWALLVTILLHVGLVWILFGKRIPTPPEKEMTVTAVPESVLESRQSLAAQIASAGSLEQGGGGGGGSIQKTDSTSSAEGPANLRAKVEEQSRSAAELARKPVETALAEALAAASASSSQAKLPSFKLSDVKIEMASAKSESTAQKEEASSSLLSKTEPSQLTDSSPKMESKPAEMAKSASELAKPTEQAERPIAKLETSRTDTVKSEMNFAKAEIKMERAQPTRPVVQSVQVAANPQPTKPKTTSEPKKWGQMVSESFAKKESPAATSTAQENTERPETVQIVQQPKMADSSLPTDAKTAPVNMAKVANPSSAKPVESRVPQESLSQPEAASSNSATAPLASGSSTPIKMERSQPSSSRAGSSATMEAASGTTTGQVAGRAGERLAGESSATAGGGSSGVVSGQSSSATKGSAFEVVTAGEMAATKTVASGSQSRMASGGGGSVSLKMELSKPRSGGGSGGAGGQGALSAGTTSGISNSSNSSQSGGGQLAGGGPQAGESTGSTFSGTGQMTARGGTVSGSSAGGTARGMGALASASSGGSTGGQPGSTSAGSGIKMERGQPGGSGSGARGGSGNTGEYSAGAGGPVSSSAGGGLAGNDGPAGQGGGGRATESGNLGGAGKGNSVEGGSGNSGLGTSTVGNGSAGSGVGSGMAKGGKGVQMEGARPGNGNGGKGNGGDGSMAGGGSGLSGGKSGNGQLAGSGIKGDWNSAGLLGVGKAKIEGGALESTGLGTSLARATAPGVDDGRLFAGGKVETPTMERGPVTKSKPKPKPVAPPEETLSAGLNDRLGGKLAGADSSLNSRATVLAATKPSVEKGEAVESVTKSEDLQVGINKGEGTIRNLVVLGKSTLEELSRLNDPLILRSPELRKPLINQLGGSDETEAAIRRSLEFLTRTQEKGGYWRSPKGHKIAPTALAMLCYMGYGGKHTEPGIYQAPLQKAMDWMISQIGKDGDLHDSGRMYDQCIASLALAEAYNLTKDPKLAAAVPAVIGYIVRSQNPKSGGWRYHPYSSEPDTGDLSISGWALMALKSARLGGGATVPDETFARVGRFLDLVATGPKGGLYGYVSPKPKLSMTAEGMFCRQLLGAQPHQERMKESAEYLRAHFPTVGAKSAESNFYYWYYGSFALYQHQGPIWEEWNSKMKPILLKKQRLDGHLSGSWDAEGDREDDYGRAVSTMLATLTLEVYYRYLPLYNLQLASGEAAR